MVAMRFRVIVLALVVLASVQLSAQVILDTVTVEVVDVPLFVARGDQPVEGLTREDFELYVNGKPQPIEYFESVSARGPASTLRDRRLFLLLFDVTFAKPFALPRAQRAAVELIVNGAPGDYFAVATYSNRRGLRFSAPFTRDRETLASAILSLNSMRSSDPLAIVTVGSQRAAASEWHDLASFGGARAMDIARAEVLRAAEDQVEGLADVSERLASLEGQKHVFFLSEGWAGSNLSVHDDIVAMHRRFDAAGVFLHAVDLEGHRLGGSEALYALTSGTGGKFVYGRTDIGRALQTLSASLDRGYRIGFRPASGKGGYNTVEVRARERGLRVHHRRGFSSGNARANVADGLYLADVVLNDVPQTGTAAALTLRDGMLSALIPMRELAAQGKKAELLVYAFAADGSALMFHHEVIPVTADEAKTFVIAVPEGTTVAKALLQVEGSVGFSRTEG
jgi:VWFA-related protein